jgi:hypothetical protein
MGQCFLGICHEYGKGEIQDFLNILIGARIAIVTIRTLGRILFSIIENKNFDYSKEFILALTYSIIFSSTGFK